MSGYRKIAIGIVMCIVAWFTVGVIGTVILSNGFDLDGQEPDDAHDMEDLIDGWW